MTVLIIGYGSPLAGDDAAGPEVARRLQDRPGVTVRILHQLTPELAAEVAAVDRVIFVDAAVSDDVVRIRRLEPALSDTTLLHTSDPAAVLHLADVVFGRVPPAFLVTVPARRFGIGSRLSPSARRHVVDAVGAVESLTRSDRTTDPRGSEWFDVEVIRR